MDTSFNNHFTMAMDLSRGQHTSSSGALGGSTGSSRSSSHNELSMTSSQSESSQSPLSQMITPAEAPVDMRVDMLHASTRRRRRGAPIPDHLKDAVYWEKRAKNNKAAKNSRDNKRAKEKANEEALVKLMQRFIHLQGENAALKAELFNLESQTLMQSMANAPHKFK